MTFDFTFSLSHLLTIITSSAIVVWNFFHWKAKLDRTEEKAENAMKQAIEAGAKAATLEKQVLSEYASMKTLEKLEDRLSGQMDKMLSELGSIRQFLMERK